MFTTALLIIAKNWKQLRCPSIDEWINKLQGTSLVVQGLRLCSQHKGCKFDPGLGKFQVLRGAAKKKNAIHPDNGILFSNRRNYSIELQKGMEEP